MARHRWPRLAARDHGMVTAETAVVLPALLTVVAAALWLLAAAGAQLRCVDAAHDAARAAARGDDAGRIRAAATGSAPTGATVEVTRRGAQVDVVVRAEVRPFGGLVGLLPALPVSASAAVPAEPGPGEGP